MPYDVASPVASAAAALGGYLDARSKKRQQDVENQQRQQQISDAAADAAARLALQQSQDQATNAYRTTQTQQRGRQLDIDAANSAREQAAADVAAAKQAEADKKQKLLEAFQGQGLHYPKNYAKMKPEEKIAYLQVRLNAAQKAGDKTTVANTETEINRVATDAAAAAKADAPPKPTWADLHPKPRAGRTLSPQEQYFDEHGYMPPSYSEAHPKPSATKDSTLAGQVESLRTLYAAHQYQKPNETPDQTAAWFKSQGFPPAAIMEVAPAFAGAGGGGGTDGAAKRTPVPPGTHPGAMLKGKPIFVQNGQWVFQDGSPAQ